MHTPEQTNFSRQINPLRLKECLLNVGQILIYVEISPAKAEQKKISFLEKTFPLIGEIKQLSAGLREYIEVNGSYPEDLSILADADKIILKYDSDFASFVQSIIQKNFTDYQFEIYKDSGYNNRSKMTKGQIKLSIQSMILTGIPNKIAALKKHSLKGTFGNYANSKAYVEIIKKLETLKDSLEIDLINLNR